MTEPDVPPTPPRSLTKPQLANLLGVSTRTVTAWVARGCPATVQPGGPHLFNEAEVRTWRADLYGLDPRPPGETTEEATRSRADLVRRVNQAKRSELELEAEQALKTLGLDKLILAAKTYKDFKEIDLQIGAVLSRGAMTPARANAIRSAIADARQNQRAQQETEVDDEPEKLFLLTLGGEKIARAYESMECEERRERVLNYVLAEAAVDLAEHPNVDLTRMGREAEGVDTKSMGIVTDEDPE